jgi:SecD/SecF fusion protein
LSDLRFLKELGAEFERVGEQRAGEKRADRSRRPRVRMPRAALAVVGLGLSVLVVAAVLAVGLGVHSQSRTGSPKSDRGSLVVVLSARALDPRSPLGPSLDRSIHILRQRLGSVFHGVRVSRAKGGIVIVAPHARTADRARILALALAVPTRLAFYDWEANALTSNGKTVASQLRSQNATAIEISQGAGSAAPGEPGAGSTSLYAAVALASRQPSAPTIAGLARKGREYYLFGAPGSVACATAAKDQHTSPTPGAHCMLLSAPVDETTDSPQLIAQDIASALLPGIKAPQGQQLAVPQGTVVLQAAPAHPGQQTTVSSPSAQFFVLKDHVALLGKDITNPRQSTDQSGEPDVEFGLSSSEAHRFQRATGQIARRGSVVSGLGQTLSQHFAVALDGKLLTVPSIDFKTYPDGIPDAGVLDITGGFTVQSARDLATVLRFGPLSVSLLVR